MYYSKLVWWLYSIYYNDRRSGYTPLIYTIKTNWGYQNICNVESFDSSYIAGTCSKSTVFGIYVLYYKIL